MGKENTQEVNVSDTSIENRSAFRIDDSILLSLRVIPDDQIQDFLKKYPENNAELQLLNDFSDSSKALTDQFALLRRRYPEVAKYLKILDDKINIWKDWLNGYAIEFYLHFKVLTLKQPSSKRLKYSVNEVPCSKFYREFKEYSKISPVKDFWDIAGTPILLKIGLRK